MAPSNMFASPSVTTPVFVEGISEPVSSIATPSAPSIPKGLSKGAYRRLKKQAAKRSSVGELQSVGNGQPKRPRTDDSDSRKAPNRDLEVIIDNQAEPDCMLTMDQVNRIRYEVLQLRRARNLPETSPIQFVLDGCHRGVMRISCLDTMPMVWLRSKRDVLNGSVEGAQLRLRMRSEMPRYTRVRGFFPVPKPVDVTFLMALLWQQNDSVDATSWKVLKFERREGPDPLSPMRGAGYYVVFELDEMCLQSLRDAGDRVFFSVSTVKLTGYGDGRKAKEVSAFFIQVLSNRITNQSA